MTKNRQSEEDKAYYFAKCVFGAMYYTKVRRMVDAFLPIFHLIPVPSVMIMAKFSAPAYKPSRPVGIYGDTGSGSLTLPAEKKQKRPSTGKAPRPLNKIEMGAG